MGLWSPSASTCCWEHLDQPFPFLTFQGQTSTLNGLFANLILTCMWYVYLLTLHIVETNMMLSSINTYILETPKPSKSAAHRRGTQWANGQLYKSVVGIRTEVQKENEGPREDVVVGLAFMFASKCILHAHVLSLTGSMKQ